MEVFLELQARFQKKKNWSGPYNEETLGWQCLKPPTSSAIYYHMLDDFESWHYSVLLAHQKISHISHIIPVLLVICIWICIYTDTVYQNVYRYDMTYNIDMTNIICTITIQIAHLPYKTPFFNSPQGPGALTCCNSDIWHGSARGSPSHIHSSAFGRRVGLGTMGNPLEIHGKSRKIYGKAPLFMIFMGKSDKKWMTHLFSIANCRIN